MNNSTEYEMGTTSLSCLEQFSHGTDLLFPVLLQFLSTILFCPCLALTRCRRGQEERRSVSALKSFQEYRIREQRQGHSSYM